MKRFVLFLLLSMEAVPLWAEQIKDLYTLDVPVQNKSAAGREIAIEKMLRILLLRLTGNSHIIEQKFARVLSKNGSRYVRDFRYRSARDNDGKKTLFLRVNFDESLINQELRKNNYPIWGSERPVSLVWFALEDAQGLRLLSPYEGDGLHHFSVVQNELALYALPVVFPLMDLEDRRNTSAAIVRDGIASSILEASKRYPAKTVLAVYLTETAGSYSKAKWTFLANGKALTWGSRDALPDVAISLGISQFARQLAGVYAQKADGRTNLEMIVNNVFTFSQYASTLKYLNSLQIVKEVKVTTVDQGRFTLRVVVHGSKSEFDQTISSGNDLRLIRDTLYRYLKS